MSSADGLFHCLACAPSHCPHHCLTCVPYAPSRCLLPSSLFPGNVQAVVALLKAGADPWLGDMSVRRTCVHYAAGKGHVEVVQAIIEWVRTNAPMDHYTIPPESPAPL